MIQSPFVRRTSCIDLSVLQKSKREEESQHSQEGWLPAAELPLLSLLGKQIGWGKQCFSWYGGQPSRASKDLSGGTWHYIHVVEIFSRNPVQNRNKPTNRLICHCFWEFSKEDVTIKNRDAKESRFISRTTQDVLWGWYVSIRCYALDRSDGHGKAVLNIFSFFSWNYWLLIVMSARGTAILPYGEESDLHISCISTSGSSYRGVATIYMTSNFA